MVDPTIFYEHTRRTGEVICQICCESKPMDQMEPVSEEMKGTEKVLVWDICQDCATMEKAHGATY